MKTQYLTATLVLIALLGTGGVVFFFQQNTENEEMFSNGPPAGNSSDVNIIREEYSSTEECRSGLVEYSEGEAIYIPNLQKDIACHFVIHPELPDYVFHIVSEVGKNEIQYIEIYSKDKLTEKQVFEEFLGYPADEFLVESEDINFDNYLDVRIPAWYGTDGSLGFYYFIFKPNTQSFELTESLFVLSNPKPNPSTQTITSDQGIYKWQNGQLIEFE